MSRASGTRSLELVGPGADIGLSGAYPEPPAGWEILGHGAGVQLVETDVLSPRPDDEAILLGADDVPEMLAIVERNQPGPFRPRTYELGRYVGIRREGRLVAMAGERMHPEGWTEISAVATDAEYRRQGLASRLVLDVAFHIQEPRRPGAHARRGDQRERHRGVRAPRVRPAHAHDLLGRAHPGVSRPEPTRVGTLRLDLDETVALRDRFNRASRRRAGGVES